MESKNTDDDDGESNGVLVLLDQYGGREWNVSFCEVSTRV